MGSSIPKSKLLCPVCEQPLCVLPAAAGRVLIWCGWGPCTSMASNDGAMGKTEEEALAQLKRYIDEEDSKAIPE